jgi:hypothetical protein
MDIKRLGPNLACRRFIVSTVVADNRAVVRFYNKRGARPSSGSRKAVMMTRLLPSL